MQATTSTLPHDGDDVSDRVRHHTSARVRERLARRRRANLEEAIAGGPERIVERLDELGKEWNVDRALLLLFAMVGTVAHELERHVDRRFGWLLRAQIAFLGVHAAVGWSPPVPVLRRLGFRTQQEIDAERLALKRALEPMNER
jgi:hypothetical protein